MKYRKKSIEIEAVKWTGKNRDEIRAFCPHDAFFTSTMQDAEGHTTAWTLLINSFVGMTYAETGDYVVKDIDGKFYLCDANIFEEAYERVEV